MEDERARVAPPSRGLPGMPSRQGCEGCARCRARRGGGHDTVTTLLDLRFSNLDAGEGSLLVPPPIYPTSFAVTAGS